MGPNVKKLVAHKVALDAIPSGGGLQAGIAFLMDKYRIIETTRKAQEWVAQAIALVKTAPDNQYGDDDEAIAGAILQGIKERQGKKGICGRCSQYRRLPEDGYCADCLDLMPTMDSKPL